MVLRPAFVAAFVSRHGLMVGVSPLVALALMTPGAAFAQTNSAQQAGTPQDQATAPSAQNNAPSPAGEVSEGEIIVTGFNDIVFDGVLGTGSNNPNAGETQSFMGMLIRHKF